MTQPQENRTALLLAPPIYTGFELRKAQDRAITPLLTRIRQLFHIRGVPVTQGQRQEMALYTFRVMTNARTRTYQASARYLHGQGVTDVPPLRPYRVDAVEQMLEQAVPETVSGEPVDESTRTTAHVVEQARKSVARAASRHAQQPARETVQEAADEGGSEIGWARVLVGVRSCAFCAMLASRGPVYTSDKAALFRGGGAMDAYHNGCDCIAVLVRRGAVWEGADSHMKLQDLWADSTRSQSNADARNAFRRQWDKLVRDGGSGEFIAESMKPPGGAE